MSSPREDSDRTRRLLDRAVRFGWLSSAAAEDLEVRLRSQAGPGFADLVAAGRLSSRQVELLESRPSGAHETAELDMRAFSDEGFRQRFGKPAEVGLIDGRFEIRELLGEGGMGEVWLAHDHDLKREVAIKFVKGPRRNLRKFVDEAQITGQLEHPNIVPIHELRFGEDGQPFLVMPRVRGQSLWELLQQLRRDSPSGLVPPDQRPPSSARDSDRLDSNPEKRRQRKAARLGARVLQRLLQIFLKICDAVAYAHSRGVLHRDLKPENIMIGPFGQVLVMDWGLAKLLDRDEEDPDPPMHTESRASGSPQTAWGTVVGTLCYMAPEQAAGRTTEIDERADIYALGAILYNLLCLEVPFDDTDSDPRRLVIAGAFRRPSERAPDRAIPVELEAIVLHAMQTRQEDRYPDVASLMADVEAYLEGHLVAAHSYSSLQIARKWVRRRRGLVLTMLGVVAALVCVLVALQWSRSRWEDALREEERIHLQSRVHQIESVQQELDLLVAQLPNSSDYVLSASERLADRLAAFCRELAADASLLEHQPESLLQAQMLQSRLEQVRGQAFHNCAASELRWLEQATLTPAQRAAWAGAAWRRHRAAQPGTSPAPLPLAGFALQAAQAELARGRLPEVASWVAEAFAFDPSAKETGEGFLLLARHAEGEGQIEVALHQFHTALSAFGNVQPRLQAEALLGLARTLLNFGSVQQHTPFAIDVPPRVMALRCLLELCTADGTLRPDVHAALAVERRPGFSAEAAQLLALLVEISLPACPADLQPLDLDGDGRAESYARWDAAQLRLELHELLPSSGLGRPVSQLSSEVDYRIPIATLNAAEQTLEGPVFIDLAPRGLCAIFILHDVHLLVCELQNPAQPLYHGHIPADFHGIFSHDFDNDGRSDLLVGSGPASGDVLVLFQEESGRLTHPRELRRRSAGLGEQRWERLEAGGKLLGLVFDDLDGDQRPELAMHLGGPTGYSLEVWQPRPDRTFEILAQADLAAGRLDLIRTPGGEARLVSLGRIDAGLEHYFQQRGTRAPETGLRIFRFADGELQQVHQPRWSETLPEGAVGVQQVRFADTERLLWSLDDGCMLSADGPRPALLLRNAWLRKLPGQTRWQSQDELGVVQPYRRARGLEMQALADAPVPRAGGLSPGSDVVSKCVLLSAFEMPLEAARLARAAMHEATGADAPRLRQILVRNLAGAGRWEELWQVLVEMQPQVELAGELPAMVEECAWRREGFGEAAGLLERWSLAAGMDVFGRQLLEPARQRMRQAALTMAQPAIDWQGAIVLADGEPLPLARAIVSGDVRFADWQNLCFRSQARPAFLRLLRKDQQLLTSHAEVAPTLAGVPVHWHGGRWRLVADIQIRALPAGSAIEIGLTSFPGLLSDLSPAAGFRIWAAGLPGSEHARVWGIGTTKMQPGLLVEDLARPLRVTLDYAPETGRLLLSLTDPARDVLLARSESSAPAWTPGLYLLGPAVSSSYQAAEFVLDRLVFFADAALVPRSDRVVHALLDSMPDLHGSSQAVCAILEGRAADAASSLRGLAQSWEQTDPAVAAGPQARSWRDTLVRELGFDAARCAHPGDLEALAGALRVEAAGAMAEVAMTWQAQAPQLSPLGLWLFEAVGQSIVGGMTVAAREGFRAQLLAQAVEFEAGRHRLESGPVRAAASWAFGDRLAALDVLRATRDRTHAEQRNHQLLLQLLALLQATPSHSAEQATLYSRCLLEVLLREAGLAHAGAGAFFDQQRRALAAGRIEAARQREEAHASGPR